MDRDKRSDASASVPAIHGPFYSRAETVADGAVHVAGLLSAPIAIIWLSTAAAMTIPRIGASVLVYGVGMIGMLSASAAYNLARPGPAKMRLRRLDHAMIYVMIAGSYTPFALNAFALPRGLVLCGTEWGLGLAGIALGFMLPDRLRLRVSFLLYLGMGWLIVFMLRPLADVLPAALLAALLAGGLVYTAGAVLHARGRMPFHNAIWHAMVLVAAGLQFAAVAGLLRRASV